MGQGRATASSLRSVEISRGCYTLVIMSEDLLKWRLWKEHDLLNGHCPSMITGAKWMLIGIWIGVLLKKQTCFPSTMMGILGMWTWQADIFGISRTFLSTVPGGAMTSEPPSLYVWSFDTCPPGEHGWISAKQLTGSDFFGWEAADSVR